MRARGRGLVRGALAAALGTLTAFMAGYEGGGPLQPAAGPPVEPPERRDGDVGSSPIGTTPEERGAEKVGEVLGRLVRSVGAQAELMRERVEGLYGMYRLLKALGMTDQEIAALIARQGGTWLERELAGRAPTAADTRRLLDSLQETVIRAAATVDEGMDLHGDFVRRVREGAQATRPGREDAILAVERGVAAAREQVRRLLNEGGRE